MKINDKIPHGKIGHFCDGGCTGYAQGGQIEQGMDQNARVKAELGIAPHSGTDSVVSLIPGLGLMSQIGKATELQDALNNPELLASKYGPGWNLGTNNRRNSTAFDHEADVQMLSAGGVVEDKHDPSEIPEDIKLFVEKVHKDMKESRPDEEWKMGAASQDAKPKAYKKDDEEADKDAMTFIKTGKTPMDTAVESDLPHYDEGGAVGGDNGQADLGEGDNTSGAPWDVRLEDAGKDAFNQVTTPLKDLGNVTQKAVDTATSPEMLKAGADMLGASGIPGISDLAGNLNLKQALSDNTAEPNTNKDLWKPSPMATPALPSNPANSSPMMGNTPTPIKSPSTMMPDMSDQDFMNKASNMLGLSPDNQAAFLKLLGDKAQEGQIGAGIAGIGDAIASGGTLGKVNPGGLKNAEELIQNKEKQGVEGTQMLRENAVQNFELGQKLKANAPYSPEMQKALVEEFHVPAALANAPRSTLEQLLPEAAKIEVANRELEFNKAKMAYEGQAGASDKAASIAQPYDEKINTINNLLATIQAGKSPDTKALQSAGINTHWYTANDSPGTMKALNTIKQQLVAQRNEAIQKMTASNPLSGNVSEQYKPDKAKPTPQDMAAYQHAKANPNDPKSKQILAILQKKGLI